MQGIGQLLASSLLLFSLLSVLAQNSDDRPSQITKRSADDLAESGAPCRDKRFNEFVGKRAEGPNLADKRYEFIGKRMPYEFVGKRPYEFVGKRYEFVGKRIPYEFVGKRPSDLLPADKRYMVDVYGKRVQLPYEFVGKRIFGKAWGRLNTDSREGNAMLQDVSEIRNTRETGRQATGKADSDDVVPSASKRYSEWLGKRNDNGQIPNQLLRELVNKRISAIVQSRLRNKSNPEFIGRREEFPGQEEAVAMRKRYTEFIGK